MQKTRLYSLLVIAVICFAFTKVNIFSKKGDIDIVLVEKSYIAGQDIVLKFKSNNNAQPLLYCSNSYGSTVITPSLKNSTLNYSISKLMCNKSGIVFWKIINTSKDVSGSFNITPQSNTKTLESYLGPPSIEAGQTDYSMLVVIPTDSLDNPASNGKIVTTKKQFLTTITTDSIKTNNLIAFKNFYSEKESGRMLISSTCDQTYSKEFTVDVTAAIPTNFTIEAKRPHPYADGNQITTFYTSIIKDKNKNIVSDGTYVSFFIKDENYNSLHTSGTTINGIASAKMISPDHEQNWQIQAFIEGIAQSNSITLKYLQAVKDFDVTFSNQNRTITIGPITSFMDQKIPDGLQVTLTIYNNNNNLERLVKNTFNGTVSFELNPAIYKSSNYNFTIKAAGKTYTFKNKKLW
ncbi:hypothetical protein OOZ35_08855 [Mesoflavibacter profundi]|uniref:Uncharacterized protein n=1 Tax=Mesoflavibacter profundi TaxID=2708110 RepID=A0ABT4S0J3_9FLAO|nr:hypothetical protein [Mesoflavibacter profundi]MDA0177596.1 hypothetical protein [Mesoflavibacter profundi]